MTKYKLGNDEEVKALSQSLVRFFYSKNVNSKDDAHDLAQETFLRVLETMDKGVSLQCPTAYAIGVAKKVFLEYCRKVSKSHKYDGIEKALDLTKGNTPLTEAIDNHNVLSFNKAFKTIPNDMRELLVERFIKEVPAQVIADRIGIPTGAIDTRVYRAKKELKRHIG